MNMTIGTSIFLIALGAILSLAVNATRGWRLGSDWPV
jgi:hypothetical protein